MAAPSRTSTTNRERRQGCCGEHRRPHRGLYGRRAEAELEGPREWRRVGNRERKGDKALGRQ